jgi:UDP-galactopyranose mutase
MKKYDFLIVGSGLFGSTVAFELNKRGYKTLVIEKRNHIGGNIFTKEEEQINVHKYGAHIFHTSNQTIWEYINQFANFNNYINSPLADYNGQRYHLPFNMNTFKEIWPDIETKEDVIRHIEEEKKRANIKDVTNLGEQAISLVGTTIYEKLVKGYTEKQWGRKCKDLPSFIIKRLPLRFEFNNNYFNDTYQGIPIGGYTQISEKMLAKSDVLLNSDFLANKEHYLSLADKTIYTGALDDFFDCKYGALDYRSLRFEEETLDMLDYQGVAVINYTSSNVPYTRIIEHKHFEDNISSKTIITKEYPLEYQKGFEKYYPVNDEKNQNLYQKYLDETKSLKNIYFGGRLASYKYFDMDDTIEAALNLVNEILK